MGFRLCFVFLSAFVLISCSDSKPKPGSKKAMQAELQELKAKSELEALHIKELEIALEVEKSSQNIEEAMASTEQQTQAEFEATKESYQQAEQSLQAAHAHMKARSAAEASSEEENGGFSFVAVRSIPPPAPPSNPAAHSTSPASNYASAQSTLTPESEKLAFLRQELRDEINRVFDEIRARRSARYGEKNGDENSSPDTYIKLNSYDPETGRNKRGGKKPKLAIDLNTALNEKYPEESTCLDNLSLSATFLRARALRSEIIELKNQTGLK